MDEYIRKKSVTVGLDYIINELNKLITDDSPNDGYTDIKNQVEEIKRGVLNIPPADVQPVVRCGECAYFRQHREQSDWCVNWNATVDDIYGFCSEGKRRGDNNEID